MRGGYIFVCLNWRCTSCENVLKFQDLSLFHSFSPYFSRSVSLSLFSFLSLLPHSHFCLSLLSLLSQVAQDVPTENCDLGWKSWGWMQHKEDQKLPWECVPPVKNTWVKQMEEWSRSLKGCSCRIEERIRNYRTLPGKKVLILVY